MDCLSYKQARVMLHTQHGLLTIYQTLWIQLGCTRLDKVALRTRVVGSWLPGNAQAVPVRIAERIAFDQLAIGLAFHFIK